ncbi:MAG: C45 family autoproteolytic acyltransferase/hydrolase [Promethearchaeota archaeon]
MVIFIETKGTHAEMGLQQGEKLRADISAAEEAVFHGRMIQELKPKIIPTGFLKFVLGMLGKRSIKKAIEQHMPAQIGKIEGIAKGSGLSTRFNYGLHWIEVYTGLPKTVFRNPPVQACSMVFALPGATADGSVIYARNYDFPNVLREFQMVRRDVPDDGYKNITMTQFPLAGSHIGLNEKGVCIGLNYGRSWKKRPLDFRLKGVPSTLIVQHALENCATTEEVVEFVSKFPARSNGAHYGVADKSGDAAVVETTSTRFGVRRAEGGILAHTNHYQTPDLLDANTPDDVYWKLEGLDIPYIESPRRRYAAAFKGLSENRGKITIETVKAILRDHSSAEVPGEPDDFSVCCHGKTGSTLASIIIKPETGQLWATDDLPCQTEYEEFKL